ncbi:MAG: hypothetical protein IIB19_07745 [Chloroflexi bacterium]|nr:hypothetical protein [Chloroflexota bacterium]
MKELAAWALTTGLWGVAVSILWEANGRASWHVWAAIVLWLWVTVLACKDIYTAFRKD